MMENEKQNEEELIASSFLKIRQAILSSSWELVSDAYFDISGERIENEKSKSKLEKIREKISQRLKDNGNEATLVVPDNESKQELINDLVKLGHDEPTLKKLKKSDLILLLNEKDKKKVKEKENPNAEPIITEITTIKHKGGTRFARDGFEVISTPIDAEEMRENIIKSKKTLGLPPIERPAKIEDSSTADPDSNTARLHLNPKSRPAWRD